MRLIVLTGSTGGLGTALVKRILSEQCGELICVYRNEEKFNALYKNTHHNFQSYKTSDKDDYEKLKQMIDGYTVEELVVILNAFSITPIKLVGEYTFSEIEEMVYGNVMQNVTLINMAVSIFRKANIKMRIINLDSGAANIPLMGWGNYGASKAYLNAMLAVVSKENPECKVVSFDPGVMDTAMQRQIRETPVSTFDQVSTFISYKESGMLSSPEDVATAIVRRYILDWQAVTLRERYI